MNIVQTKNLEPGMVVASPVKTRSGQLIINAGVELDNRLIARLDFYSISSVHIATFESDPEPSIEPTKEQMKEPVESDSTKDAIAPVQEDDPVDPSRFISAGNASYAQKIKRSDRFKDFQVGYSQSVLHLKESFNKFNTDDDFDPSELLASSMKILNEQKLNTIEFFDMLHNMRQDDDPTYSHCLNVAFIARILGKWMKMDKQTVDDLTLAGLLHDVGKTMIPKAILTKPGKLSDSEYQVIKMHPQFGYELLKNKGLKSHILSAVINHHERCDGSGYPNGLHSDQLDDFTMIIAIADVYDAMTAARTYRNPLCPFTVIENFENEGLQKYRPHVILTFLERIANTYQHNRVLLSNGKQGTIVLLNNGHLSKPILQLDDGQFLDLSKEPSISIISII